LASARDAGARLTSSGATTCLHGACVPAVPAVSAGGAWSVRGYVATAAAAARVQSGKAEEHDRERAITRSTRTRRAAVRTPTLLFPVVTLAKLTSAKHTVHRGFHASVVKDDSTAVE
jgi:hypothetical protein